jgi:uncharacterized membrane protein
VGVGFWWAGAKVVSAFAGIELVVVAAAFAAHAVHACDGERLWLRDGRLHVERRRGWRLEQRDFDLARLQVQPSDGAALELRDRAGAWRVGEHVTALRREQVRAELLRARAEAQQAPWAK